MDNFILGLSALQSAGIVSITSAQSLNNGQVYQALLEHGGRSLDVVFNSKNQSLAIGDATKNSVLSVKRVSELGALRVVLASFSYGDGEFKDFETYPEVGLTKTIKNSTIFPAQCSDLGMIYSTHSGHRMVHSGEDQLVSLVAFKNHLDSGCESNFLLTAGLIPLQSVKEPKTVRSSLTHLDVAQSLAQVRFPHDLLSPDSEFIASGLLNSMGVEGGDKPLAPQVILSSGKNYLSSELELATKVRNAAWDLIGRSAVKSKLELESGIREPIFSSVTLIQNGTKEKPETVAVLSSAGGYSLRRSTKPLDLESGTTYEGEQATQFLRQSRDLLVRRAPEDLTHIVSGSIHDIKALKVEPEGVIASVFDGVNLTAQPLTKIIQALDLPKDWVSFNRISLVDFGRNRLQAPVFQSMPTSIDDRHKLMGIKRAWQSGRENEGRTLQALTALGLSEPEARDYLQISEKRAMDYKRSGLGQARRPIQSFGNGPDRVYGNREKEGLEGPFRYKNGRTVYYDSKEGKYYDPDADLFLDEAEAATLHQARRPIQSMADDGFYADDDPDFEPEGYTPEEDDGYITPTGPLGGKTTLSVEGKNIGTFSSDQEAIDAFKAWCETNQYWPNLWQVSDHGNTELVDLSQAFDPSTTVGTRPGPTARKAVEGMWAQISSYVSGLRQRGIKSRQDIITSLQRKFPTLGEEGAREAYYQYHAAHQGKKPTEPTLHPLHQSMSETMSAYESEELDEEEVVQLFSDLIKQNVLQGLDDNYRSMGERLIEAGYLDAEGNIL